jgi:hypothetical protein
MLTGRAGLSTREGGGPRTDSVRFPGGPWASSDARLEGSPAASFYFSLFFCSFFLFSYFITFANLHQNNSNHFLNSSKIPSNVLN